MSSLEVQSSAVMFIETGIMQHIMSESVLNSALNDDAVHWEFQQFNNQREILYNETMKEVGLCYRFTCAVIDSRIWDSIPQIIGTTLPPARYWWDNNFILINGTIILGIHSNSTFAFCGPKSKYSIYWPLIQFMYNFLSKYMQDHYWYSSDETWVEFWKAVETVCQKVKSKCHEESSCEEIKIFLEQIKGELSALSS